MEPLKGETSGMSGLSSVSTKRQRIAQLAKQAPDMVLTSLSHHIDIEWLREAFVQTRKDGAPGVDGQKSDEYAARLDENLASLLDRAKSGAYRAPPVRRAYIPKGDGSEQRPIGIPTFEDKVLQRAAVMALEPVYEQDFLDCSYGFRPGRSVHQALEGLRSAMMSMAGGWVYEVDVRQFYDTLDHRQVQELVRRRVRDGVLLRLIGKWLNAGVFDDGQVQYPEQGTPQGGVISPLLANIYLHEVLDKWFEREVKPRMKGRVVLVRYADDFVIVFSCEEDARRVAEVLPKRFAKHGLTLHPDKTRLIAFGSPNRRRDGSGDDPGTFNFLGFTHCWGKTQTGGWTIKRRTAAGRFRRAVRWVGWWCRGHRHEPIKEQRRQLNQKLKGHYGFYGVRGNSKSLKRFLWAVERVWFYWLNRRSQRRHRWEWFQRVLRRFPLLPARLPRRPAQLGLPLGANP